jgi:hypothetical protein
MYCKAEFQSHLCDGIESQSKGDDLRVYANTKGLFWPPGARSEPPDAFSLEVDDLEDRIAKIVHRLQHYTKDDGGRAAKQK